MRFLLDTSVLSEPIKSRPDERVLARIEQHDGELATCAIVWHDGESASWHAQERGRLGRRGRSTSAADGQIAAITRVNELVLVTANVRDFRRFEGLDVQDWTR